MRDAGNREGRELIDSACTTMDNRRGGQGLIGFGELHKLSFAWGTDIAAVERAYALDWLIAGLFQDPRLGPWLAVVDETALGKAYFPDYPQPEQASLAVLPSGGAFSMNEELTEAAERAASASGLQYRLDSQSPTEARFEYAGPLGRRSAAQPHLILRLFPGALQSPPVEAPLIHPFSDRIETTIQAVSLEELAAGRLVLLGGRPRARDVFDLWFILTSGAGRLDRVAVRALAEENAAAKGRPLRPGPEPSYEPLLAKAWENALRKIPQHPPFMQALSEIQARVGAILFA